MKKPKEIYLLQDNLLQKIDDINTIVYTYIKNIKKEYKNNLSDELDKLLSKIAEGENLDINMLKKKYSKSKKYSDKTILSTEEEELLDTITINDITYYYENKENGKVYNKNNKIIGTYINSKVIFNC